VELEHAFHQGKYFAGIAKKLKGSAWSLCPHSGSSSSYRKDLKHLLQLHHTVDSLVCVSLVVPACFVAPAAVW
jgi:hypothetical protein